VPANDFLLGTGRVAVIRISRGRRWLMSGMRAKALVAVGFVCATGIVSVPAEAAPPLPRVRFTVPRVDMPVPSAGRALAESEWSGGSRLFQQRLESAGSPEKLAVEETMLAVGRQRLREAAKSCLEHATGELLQTEVAALASGHALPDRQQSHDALESGIDQCLGEVLPAAAAPARQELSGLLADQAIPVIDEAVQSSTTVAASITWPSQPGAGVDPAPPPGPVDDDDSPFPWPGVVVVGAVGGAALLLHRRRRS
jgi:hypothetical protein